MNTTKIKLINKCWNYLSSLLLDDTTPEVIKNHIILKLFRLTPDIYSITLQIQSKNKTFNLKYNRRDYPELRIWQLSVLKRDNYKCIKCNSTKRLEIHHIKKWADYPLERFNIDNGQTLCHKCHSKTINYGNKNNAIC